MKQHTLMIYSNNELIAIVPLCISFGMERIPIRDPYVLMSADYKYLPTLKYKRIAPIRRLSFPLCLASANIRGGFIAGELRDEIFDAVSQYLNNNRDLWDIAVFDGLQKCLNIGENLKEKAIKNTLIIGKRITERQLLKISLPLTMDDFWKSKNKHFRERARNEIAKLKKYCEENGGASVREYRGKDIEAGLTLMFEMEQNSWKVKSEKSRVLHLALDDRIRGFHRDVAKEYAENDQAQILFVFAGERPIGCLYSLENASIASMILTYRVENIPKQLSIISSIWEALLSSAISRGLTTIDINGYTRNYLKWATESVNHERVILFNNNLYSRSLATLDNLACQLSKQLP
jgi:hypothetical protein